MLLLLTCFIGAILARVWTVGDVESADYRASELATAVAKASAGDIIELLGGEFVVPQSKASNIGLVVDKSLTIRTAADATTRSILRAEKSDGIDALIGVGANNVVLENFVVGKPLAGLAFSTERMVGIYVSAGTQATPSGLSTNDYNSPAADLKKRAPGLDAVQVVRHLDAKRSRTFEDANRLLRNVAIRNIDFSAAGAHTGVAFGMGSYSNARVERSTFAADASTDAIVSVVGALFDESSLIDLSIFNGAPVVLKGNGPTIGTNYWTLALRGSHATFCIDRGCTKLGPVVDGDQFNSRAFATIADAVAANVRKIVVTGRSVDLYRSGSSPVTIIRPGTTIQGDVADNCEPDADGAGAAVATINIRNAQNGNSGALISLDCALSEVSNVIFMLQADSPRVAVAFVAQDATRRVTVGAAEEELGNTALFSNVKFLGDSAGQIAIHSASPITRLGVTASSFVGFGIQHDAGTLVVADSEFVDNSVTGITLAGKGKRGLRVSNSLFAISGTAIAFSNVKASDMLELNVQCSQFLFAVPRLPTDCGAGTFCATAYVHNTIVAAPKQLTLEERKMFSAGLNHYEEDTIDNIGRYAAFTGKADRSQISFALTDHQGRIDDVSGVVTMVGTNTRWHFALVTSIPMRQECFASSVPSGNDPQGPARVVSNYIRVASDAPKQCISVAIRVSLSGAEVELHDGEDLSIYAIQHLGGAMTKWTRAVSHTISIDDNGASLAVEASSGGGTLTRAVVVAAHASQAEKAAALSKNVNQLAAGSNAVLVATKLDLQLCVACGTDRIPAQISDERCGGGLQQPIFKSIEDALAEVQKIPAAAKTTSVSILVYGTQCAVAKCSIDLATTAPVTKLVVEGLAVDVRGTIRRPSSCNRDTPFVNVNSGGVTLRYLLLGADTSLTTAIPKCVINVPASRGDGPRIAFTSISGGVCIGDKRPKTMLLGNEIAAAPKTAAISVINGESLTLESNSIMVGNVLFGVFGGAVVAANRFGQDVSVVSTTKETSTTVLKLSGNVFASRRADGAASEITCIDAGLNGVVQSIGDSFGDNCILLLGKKSSIANSVLNNVAVIATDGRFVNVTLAGLNSKIKSIGLAVLETVRIDLASTQLGLALPGEPKRQFPCAKLHEARLATYDLAKSTIFDLASGKRLLVEATARWPAVPTAFVSTVDGAVVNCVKDSTDDYCRCVAGKPIVSTTTLPPSSVTKKPTATPVANVLANAKEEVVVANDRKKQITADPQCAAACVSSESFVVGPCISLDIRDIAGATQVDQPRCKANKCMGPDSTRTQAPIVCASEQCIDANGANTDGKLCGCTTCACFYRDESNDIIGADSCEVPPTPKPTPVSNTNTIVAFVLIFGLIFCCCLCCCCFFFCIVSGSAARSEVGSTTSVPYRPVSTSSSSSSSGETVAQASALTGFMLHDESGLRKRNANGN